MTPRLHPDNSSQGGLDGVFGFDLDADAWLRRVRSADSPNPLGRVGAYEILGIIGRGGQGVVYKVRQPRTGREIALKRLSAGAFATPSMRARFDREIEAAAALDHPNIVTVFGSEGIDDQLVLAMQWIDGEPFDRWAAPPGHPRRELREVLAAFLSVCDALRHAHQRGIIHRDLKPSNILVDRDGRPQVLDFGLAKFHGADSSSISLTETGAVVGTPIYAAPELLGGSLRDIDVRCDVYALGALLYHALTGRPPHEPMGDIVTLIAQVREREPPPPASLDPRIDRELDAIIRKAMSKEKDRRYLSVEALSEDIHRYLDGAPVLAHPPSTGYRARKFLRQHRGAVGAAAALLLTLTSATIVSVVFYVKAAAARIEVQEKLDASNLANRRKDSLLQFVRDILAQADPTITGPGETTIRKAVDSARARFESDSAQYEPAVAAPLQDTMAAIYLSMASPAEAVPLARRSVELYRSLGAEGELGLCWALHHYGEALLGTGKLDDAEVALRESIALASRVHAAFPDSGQGAASILVKVLDQKGDLPAAIALARQRIEVLRPHAAKCKDAYAQSLNMLSLRLPCVPPDFEGLRAAQESLEAAVIAWGPDGYSTALVMSNLGSKLRLAGRLHEAADQHEKALRICNQTPGPDHPTTLKVRQRLAQTQFELGRFDESAEHISAIVAAQRRREGPRSPVVAESLSRLGTVRMSQRNFVAAEEAFREALSIRAEPGGASSPESAATTSSLGAALMEQSRHAESESALLSAYNLLSGDPSRNSAELMTVENRLAKLYDHWHAAEPNAGHGDKAAEWRTRGEALRATTQPSATANRNDGRPAETQSAPASSPTNPQRDAGRSRR